MPESQTANAVLMIRPVAFGYNKQTAVNNFFQNQPEVIQGVDIQQEALREFDDYVHALRSRGVHVLVVEDTLNPITPDSIYPNNWVSFHEDARVGLYPMFAENRRNERRPEILEFLVENGFNVEYVEDFRDAESNFEFLEGTGSLVLDRQNKICFAALSERTHPNLVIEFCEVFDYEPVMFTAFHMVGSERKPIYHTNIVLSILEHFALVGLSSIDVEERNLVVDRIKESGKILIDLSAQQVEKFAGNILEVKNDEEQHFLIMSTTAHDSLTVVQRSQIEKFCKIIPISLKTIENIGGGSARCMAAEVFLPKI